MQNIDDDERKLFQNQQYLVALISTVPPVVELPTGTICRQLREYAGVSQMQTAAACQVGLSSVTRWESGAVTHSRALDHSAYRSLLAAFLRLAQSRDPELAASIRRAWPIKPKTSESEHAA